ncbi:hypothetical protein Anas_02434, partial [Armadillidium nasatum]
MPMTNFALFMAVYRQTVTTFPAAHFFLASSCSALMILVFCFIMTLDRSREYDVEHVTPDDFSSKGPIISKKFLVRNDSRWLSTDYVAMSISSSMFEDKNNNNIQTNVKSGNENNFPKEAPKVILSTVYETSVTKNLNGIINPNYEDE